MKKNFVLVITLLAITMMATTPALAGTYFGLELGIAKRNKVLEQLRKSGARFDQGYSYKGRGSLQSIKVVSYDRFNKLGSVKEAWLQFDPQDVLYLLSVTWADAGPVHKKVQDGLDAKYRLEGSAGFGFQSSHTYKDGTTRVVLERNSFGFGSNQSTSLSYIHTPSEASVQQAKDKIEQEIRQENAARTGGDL